MMYELTYISKASPETSSDDIRDILHVSRAFNTEQELTGCLLYYKDKFTQVLEGNMDVIIDLYARIENDHRHYDVELLHKGPKTDRLFDQWSMAYLDPKHVHINDLSKKLFEENLLLYSQLTGKPSPSTKLFWNNVKKIISGQDERMKI